MKIVLSKQEKKAIKEVEKAIKEIAIWIHKNPKKFREKVKRILWELDNL